MDNPTAKELLSAYRPNGADARDPIFREALNKCKRDPGLEFWLNDQQAFDVRMSAMLNNIVSPETDRDTLQATLRVDLTPSIWRRTSRTLLPLAAALMVGGGLLIQHNRTSDPIWKPGALAVSSLTQDMRPLDFRAEDVVGMQDWLTSQGAPVPNVLPLLLQEAVGKGCKLFDDGRGNTISMLCFNIGNELVHVFVFDEHTSHYVNLSVEFWQNEHGWNLRAIPQDGFLLAVATRGNTDALNTIW